MIALAGRHPGRAARPRCAAAALFDRLGLVRSRRSALAVPVFVVGTLLVLVFAQTLHWVPAGGYVPLAQDPARHFALLAMPAVDHRARPVRHGVPHDARRGAGRVAARLRAHRARQGRARRRVLLRHVLRNALMPVVTVLALHLGTLLGGTVLVEYVFNYPGLSGLLVEAVNARDYPEVEGVVLVISILFVALNLLVDLLYAVLDPRVRHA